jgi:hypothetical protein
VTKSIVCSMLDDYIVFVWLYRCRCRDFQEYLSYSDNSISEENRGPIMQCVLVPVRRKSKSTVTQGKYVVPTYELQFLDTSNGAVPVHASYIIKNIRVLYD